MARPRRTTEEEWYDIFSTWDTEDQAVALRVLEQIHRISKRHGVKVSAAEARTSNQPSLSGLPDENPVGE